MNIMAYKLHFKHFPVCLIIYEIKLTIQLDGADFF